MEATIEVLCIEVVAEKEFLSVLYVRLGNRRGVSPFAGLQGEIYRRMEIVGKYDSLHRVCRTKGPVRGIVSTNSCKQKKH